MGGDSHYTQGILVNPDGRQRYNIGTYKERSQHFILKNYFEPDQAFHEVPFGKFCADIYNSDGITEIQTSGFERLRSKLEFFLQKEKVTVVYPCASVRRVCWCDPESGAVTSGSWRTYKNAKYRLISELLGISELFSHPALTVKLCEVRASDVRLLDGYGADRKKRATKTDTVTEEVLSITDISSAADVLALLPFQPGEKLSRKEISSSLSLKGRSLWCAVTFLQKIGVLSQTEKRGKAFIYTVKDF